MLLQNDAEQIPDLVYLEYGESKFLASVGMRVQRASGDLPPCSIVHGRYLDDVSEAALDAGHNRRVRASGG